MTDGKLSVCFLTNYLTHHQLPFCLEMQKVTEGRFILIETEILPEERRMLGYKELGEQYDFVVNVHSSLQASVEAINITDQCDVAIIGSAPEEYIRSRIKNNKITFRCAERIFKRGRLDPLRWMKHTVRNFPYRNRNMYYLLCSAYAAKDFVMCGARREKMFMWGYFPEFIEYDINRILESKEPASILWVGRLIEWKHPEISLQVAGQLKEEGYNFNLTIVGTGEMEQQLFKMIIENNLSDCVCVMGAVSPETVRMYMEKSQIFLFTSDRNEGWGAVVNEAMNSGCALVACLAAGAVPCMVENGKNGLTFDFYNYDNIYSSVRKLLDSDDLRESMSRAAYTTINSHWNAAGAAQRLITLIESIKNGTGTPYKSGIASQAKYY